MIPKNINVCSSSSSCGIISDLENIDLKTNEIQDDNRTYKASLSCSQLSSNDFFRPVPYLDKAQDPAENVPVFIESKPINVHVAILVAR